jgi:transketolase
MALTRATIPTRRAFSDRMAAYGAEDGSFAVFEADIGYSTYSHLFGDAFPDRYFNLGIAEQNMVASAAGMAANGRTVVACTYGVFLSMRALESIRSFICYPNLNVKFLSSHGGLTAAIDGVTHQATEDVAFLSTLPNMKVLCPADPVAAGKLFDVAMNTPGPVFTRLMRDPLYTLYDDSAEFTMGGSNLVREGKDITIVSYGDTVFQALFAAEMLEEKGINAEVIDMYSVKPFDHEALVKSAQKSGAVLVVENHQRRNGLGYEISNYLLKHYPVAFENLGLADSFGESGEYYKVIDKYGMSDRCICEASVKLLEKKRSE